jgi:predicted transcriptional regulator
MMEITESVYRMAKFCDALSNGVRLQLLLLLQNDSENVSELASKLERDRSTISRQLGKLADHNLVQSKASGRENI